MTRGSISPATDRPTAWAELTHHCTRSGDAGVYPYIGEETQPKQLSVGVFAARNRLGTLRAVSPHPTPGGA
jgi:hypothetical protein